VDASGPAKQVDFTNPAAPRRESAARACRLRQAFGKTSVKADVPAGIHKALWEKFLLVTAFGGVGAVSRAPIGIIRTIPETRALLQQCMEELPR
jgi:2-dehydropantoate 2-reductase